MPSFPRLYWTWILCTGSGMLLFGVGVLVAMWVHSAYTAAMTSIVMSDAMSGSSELSDALPDGELRTKDDAAEFSRARPRVIGGVFMMLVAEPWP